MLAAGDAEADADGDALALGGLADAAHDVLDLGADLGPRACDAQHADDVDEAVGDLGRLLHALGGARRPHDRDEADVVLHAQHVVLVGLLRGQVHDDEAVHAAGVAVRHDFVHAVLQEVVVVAHEDHGHDQPLRARRLHVREAVGEGGLVQQGDARGLLDGGAVGQGVGERHAELDDVRAARLQGQQGVHGALLLRVARGDEGDEGALLGGLARVKALNEAGGRHGSCEARHAKNWV
mmetsp:Transcript_27463/g.81820  ORF Transcript_27463/g.81820 Transcript_27463/m.81820 type:complete len:237 (+) Transcript_27463:1031-1741(+)